MTVAGLLMWGALSDERTGLSFIMYNVQYIYILLVINSASTRGIRFRYIASARTQQRTLSPTVPVLLSCMSVAAVTWVGCRGNVFKEPLPSFMCPCHDIIRIRIYSILTFLPHPLGLSVNTHFDRYLSSMSMLLSWVTLALILSTFFI
jgi:hypothetical protein